MKRTTFLAALLSLLMAPLASATVLDFGTGLGGPGGTVIDLGGGDFAGSGIRIDVLSLLRLGGLNGAYDVDGLIADCGPVAGNSCASLDFDTSLDKISITGSVPFFGIGQTTLLSGSFSSFSFTLDASTSLGSFEAAGPDVKDPDLLARLGLDPATPFQFFGFVIATGPSNSGACAELDNCYEAFSTDIANTAVPEPGTLLLLGTGLLGVARARRRRNG